MAISKRLFLQSKPRTSMETLIVTKELSLLIYITTWYLITFFPMTFLIKPSVDPQFCPPSTCPIRYLFNTLQQLFDGPYLLTLLTFLEPHQRLWLRDCLTPYYDLGSPNLDLDTFLNALDPLRYTLGYLGTTLGPFRHFIGLSSLRPS